MWLVLETPRPLRTAGTAALDYDMDYAFKAVPQWFDQTEQPGADLKYIEAFNDYRGLGRSLLTRPKSSSPQSTATSIHQ